MLRDNFIDDIFFTFLSPILSLDSMRSYCESNGSSKQHSDSKKLQCVGLSSAALLLFVSVVFVAKQGQKSRESLPAHAPPRHSQVLSQTQTFRASHQPFRSKDQKYQQQRVTKQKMAKVHAKTEQHMMHVTVFANPAKILDVTLLSKEEQTLVKENLMKCCKRDGTSLDPMDFPYFYEYPSPYPVCIPGICKATNGLICEHLRHVPT